MALYLLDWDGNNSRVTRVDVLDAATQQVLATQTVQAYQAGVYLVWNVQGHVVFRFTNVGSGPNAVLSGIFFDPPAGASTLTVGGTVSGAVQAGVSFAASNGGTCTASDGQGRYSCTVPQSWSGSITPSLDRLHLHAAVAQLQQRHRQPDRAGLRRDRGATPAVTTTTLGTSGTPAAVGTTVTFTATVLGNAPTGNVNFTEGGVSLSANCATAGLTGTGNSRMATCSTSALAVGTHNIVASYGGDLANLPSASAPLAQVINPAAATAASFVGTDVATQGNWKTHYGADGYAVLGDTTSYPAYATVVASGKGDYTWAAQPDDRSARAAAWGGGGADCGVLVQRERASTST